MNYKGIEHFMINLKRDVVTKVFISENNLFVYKNDKLLLRHDISQNMTLNGLVTFYDKKLQIGYIRVRESGVSLKFQGIYNLKHNDRVKFDVVPNVNEFNRKGPINIKIRSIENRKKLVKFL